MRTTTLKLPQGPTANNRPGGIYPKNSSYSSGEDPGCDGTRYPLVSLSARNPSDVFHCRLESRCLFRVSERASASSDLFAASSTQRKSAVFANISRQNNVCPVQLVTYKGHKHQPEVYAIEDRRHVKKYRSIKVARIGKVLFKQRAGKLTLSRFNGRTVVIMIRTTY